MEPGVIIDWSAIAFSDKAPLRNLNAIFIAAPRTVSKDRFTQLVKTYLPKGNIVLGISKEPYVVGFEDQPQFRMLEIATVRSIIDAVTHSKSPHKIYLLEYFQRETKFIIEKLRFSEAVFINGSWRHSFHLGETYYTLTNLRTPFIRVSPFADEAEAQKSAATLRQQITETWPLPELKDATPMNETDILALASLASRYSFDHTFQAGAVLARREQKAAYLPLATAHNQIVPYETFALHHGAQREQHFSPPNDLNHYDTVHAEVALVIAAQRQILNLRHTSLFINLLPCPTCARMIAATDIDEVVYQIDHSDGYAIQLLEAAGKTVRRATPPLTSST